MGLKLKVRLIRPEQALKEFAQRAWEKTMPELDKWMRSRLVQVLVYGGNGIQGISQTDFYKFISSDDGLSQLGIERSQPPRLLLAYENKAFSIRSYKKQMTFQFGDIAKLKVATPHPASGTGNLHIQSWLEWIVDDLPVARGYVPRSNLSPGAQKSIRLGSPLGGLMLPRKAFGSTGLWRFPNELKNFEDKWFRENIDKIQTFILEKALEIFAQKLVS